MEKTISIAIALVSIVIMATEVTKADFTFGEPTNLGSTVNSSRVEAEPSISADGLLLLFNSDRSGGSGNWDIWVTTRATTEDEWGIPVNLGPTVNSSGNDYIPSMTADGLTLILCSSRSGGHGRSDIYVTTRETTGDPWGIPMNLGPTINSSVGDGARISADGLELYINSDRTSEFGGGDIWVSTRATTNDPWLEPVNLEAPVESTFGEEYPNISFDGLTLFFSSASFASPRPGGFGESDIWMTRRKTVDADWSEPVNLGPIVNTAYIERAPSLSADGSTLYFASNRSGTVGGARLDLWQVSIEPVVDLNADGIVDAADMCIIVDNWGTDEPLCDIGPTPFGDGIVDVQDLIVLAEHLFEEVGGEDIGPIVIERRISASTDDAEEALNPGYTNWNYSSDLELVHDRIDNGGEQLVGMTFRYIDIAPGAVISNAYIEFTCDETINGTAAAYFLIWGHLTPNSDGFIEPYVISDHPKTQASVPWEPDTWNSRAQRIQTVNIAPIIQELIDQEGWAAGNAVEIIIGADPSKPGFAGVRCAESYDGDAWNAPLLHIEVAGP